MFPSHEVITVWMAKWPTHFVEPVVFGTTDPQEIAGLIAAFCQRELGSSVADYLFYESSIGSVCGVRLQDNRRVVVKIHQPNRSADFLSAMVHVQRYLRTHHYPCPTPLIDPKPLAYALATVEELIDEGIYQNAHNPIIRRSMAQTLAWLIKLTREPEAIPHVTPAALDIRLPAGITWPTPHSKLFDFEATHAGAEWIDEIAARAQARKLQGAGQLVIGHTDWSVKHLRYVGEQVRVIYDWDSLSLEKEPIIVGHAATHFPYTDLPGDPAALPDEEPRLTPEEEMRIFIAEYEIARGKPFTNDEHETLQAAQVNSLAYGARLEHALHPQDTTYPEGCCRSRLLQYRS